jgi:uncharacterized protein
MKITTVILFLLMLAGSFSAYAQSAPSGQAPPAEAAATKIDPAKEADIRHLLDLVGATSLVKQSMDQMESTMRPLLANSLPPGEYRDKLIELFLEKFRSKRDSSQVLALIIPIYDKYYTAQDIKELIHFYDSPIGKKMATVLPMVTSESQAAGSKWGEELGRSSMMEVLAEHPDLRKALEDAKANH